MNAVESEFKKNLYNETYRAQQVIQSVLSVPGSAINRFSAGNLETLKRANIRDYLLEYYEKQFSSNIMSLCLVGNHSLDELEQMLLGDQSTMKEHVACKLLGRAGTEYQSLRIQHAELENRLHSE